MNSRKVLDNGAIETIVLRMAYQIREQFFDFEELVIFGVEGEGFFLAQMLKEKLDDLDEVKIELVLLKLNKHELKKPEIQFSPALPSLKGKGVLIVDDVLNSGRTLTYCLSPLVEQEISSLRVAVLVERTYRKFPVASSITGISLSTTLEQNVIAVLSGDQADIGVFLS